MQPELKYCFEESPEFTREIDQIEDKEFLDRIGKAIMWAVERAPKSLPVVPGFNNLRYVKCSNWSGLYYVIVFRLTTTNDDTKVKLLWIEQDEFEEADA